MVRLTRELIERARAFINPMKERELDLRGPCTTLPCGLRCCIVIMVPCTDTNSFQAKFARCLSRVFRLQNPRD